MTEPMEDLSIYFIDGEGRARELAARLVTASIVFTVDPWPCDSWRFTIKTEARPVYERELVALDD